MGCRFYLYQDDKRLGERPYRRDDIQRFAAGHASGDTGFFPAVSASFAGTASANGVNGTSKGQFYGSNVDSLAGVATFTDHSKDTAFGGSKN